MFVLMNPFASIEAMLFEAPSNTLLVQNQERQRAR